MQDKQSKEAEHIFKFSENEVIEKIQELNRSLQAYKRSNKSLFDGTDMTKPISEIDLSKPTEKLTAHAKSGQVTDGEAIQMLKDAELWGLLPTMLRDRDHYRAMQDKLADMKDSLFQPEPGADMFDAEKNPFIQMQRLKKEM